MSDDGGGDDGGGDVFEETESNYEGGEYDGDEVEKEGYGSKMKSALAGLVIGPLIMIGACVFLFWNEGRNVNRVRDLDETLSLVQLVNATASGGINSNLEGDLVHVAGGATANGYLSDDIFGISVNALRLSRTVETYQWTEQKTTKTSKNSDGKTTKKTTYSYRKEWKYGLEDSGRFRYQSDHQNPYQALLVGEDQTAYPIMLGNYVLESSVTDSMYWYEALSNITADNIPQGSVAEGALLSGDTFYIAYRRNISSIPSSPEVGDTRVSFSEVPSPTDVSILGVQAGNSVASYTTSRGGEILLVERGVVSAVRMIENAVTENTYWTWGFRAGGLVLMFIGFQVACSLLTTVLEFLPGPLSFFDDVLDFGVACIGGIFSCLCSSVVIAIAWIVYRPVIGGTILAVVALIIGAFVYIQYTRKKNKSSDDKLELADSDDSKPTATPYQDAEADIPAHYPHASSTQPQPQYGETNPDYSPTNEYNQAPQYSQTNEAPPYAQPVPQYDQPPQYGQQKDQDEPPIAAPVAYGQPSYPTYNPQYAMSLPPQQTEAVPYAVVQSISASVPPSAPVVMYHSRTLDHGDEQGTEIQTGTAVP